MHLTLRWLTLMILGSLVTACAGIRTEAPAGDDWNSHREYLSGLRHWTTAGKLALRSPQQSESASLLWQQVGDATHLRLSGPLGVAATTIDSDGREVQIRRGDEYSQLVLDDRDSLYLHTGWDLPLGALPHWLKGIPDPAAKIDAMLLHPERGLLRELQQSGWTVEFEEYSEFDGLLLPTRLRIQRGEHSARLILRDWRDLSR